jgi:hypothetical protein
MISACTHAWHYESDWAPSRFAHPYLANYDQRGDLLPSRAHRLAYQKVWVSSLPGSKLLELTVGNFGGVEIPFGVGAD